MNLLFSVAFLFGKFLLFTLFFLLLPVSLMAKRRTLYILLILLALVLSGTVVVLSSISYYLYINAAAYIPDREVPVLSNTTRWNATEHGKLERIPRIIHQTWKSETLPADWKLLSEACRNMMSD